MARCAVPAACSGGTVWVVPGSVAMPRGERSAPERRGHAAARRPYRRAEWERSGLERIVRLGMIGQASGVLCASVPLWFRWNGDLRLRLIGQGPGALTSDSPITAPAQAGGESFAFRRDEHLHRVECGRREKVQSVSGGVSTKMGGLGADAPAEKRSGQPACLR